MSWSPMATSSMRAFAYSEHRVGGCKSRLCLVRGLWRGEGASRTFGDFVELERQKWRLEGPQITQVFSFKTFSKYWYGMRQKAKKVSRKSPTESSQQFHGAEITIAGVHELLGGGGGGAGKLWGTPQALRSNSCRALPWHIGKPDIDWTQPKLQPRLDSAQPVIFRLK